MNTKKTVLIVEDEKDLQNVYKLVLSKSGNNVLTANNGVEGLRRLKEGKPDVVLLDLFMPVMDGREFLQNIDVSDYPKTRFIMYTNLSDSNVEDELRELGAHQIVLKSDLTPQDLVDLVALQAKKRRD